MVTLVAITLFACEGNYKNIQKLNLTDGAPVAEGKMINLKYTDSGKVVTNLKAPELLDFSNFEFPYQEFPKGIEVHFWDENDTESTVNSDYAIRFNDTGIVDLRENVRIFTSDSTLLTAEQLYWDQTNQWLFTNKPYTITFPDGSFNNGEQFDASEDFTIFLSLRNQGIQIVDKTNN